MSMENLTHLNSLWVNSSLIMSIMIALTRSFALWMARLMSLWFLTFTARRWCLVQLLPIIMRSRATKWSLILMLTSHPSICSTLTLSSSHQRSISTTSTRTPCSQEIASTSQPSTSIRWLVGPRPSPCADRWSRPPSQFHSSTRLTHECLRPSMMQLRAESSTDVSTSHDIPYKENLLILLTFKLLSS